MSHPGEVWASWPSGRQPAALLRLPDCPRTDPADRDSACVLFDGHPGAHSWAQSDPDEERLRARTGLLEPGEVISVRTPPVGSCEHRRTEERYGITRCHACGLRLRR
jgi:hypothetical protein